MKKSISNIIAVLLLIVSIVETLPFVNGLGCDAMIQMESRELGELYGRCEGGKVFLTVNHKVTKEVYEVNGYYGYAFKRYFIIVMQRNVKARNDKNPEGLKANFFYRNVYSGLIVRDIEGRYYFMSSSPAPIMWRAKIWGRLGLF